MTNPWFKFYGGEYLSDLKMLSLAASERSCWITLLCLASQTKDGVVKFLTESKLMVLSGIEVGTEEWNKTVGVLKKFENLKCVTLRNDSVTVLNWAKRQASESYDRVQRFREKQKSNAPVTQKREEENRKEKKRIEDREELWRLWQSNPLMEKIKEKFPFRDYRFYFDEMCDWYLVNKRRLPQVISAYSNWLSRTKTDPVLVEESAKAQRNKAFEKENSTPVKQETLKKLREMTKEFKQTYGTSSN